MPSSLCIVIAALEIDGPLLGTLSSLSKQSSRDFEVAVAVPGRSVSFGSNRYPFRVKVIETPGPWEIGRARNVASVRSGSSLILFLDCQAEVGPDFVQSALATIKPGIAWAADLGLHCGENGTVPAVIVGISRADFTRIGGWDRGGESRLFLLKCESLGLKIHRGNSEPARDNCSSPGIETFKTSWTRKRQRFAEQHRAAIAAVPPPAMPGGNRLLIGVVSCGWHSVRREACKNTWLNAVASHPDVQAVFVAGLDCIDQPVLVDDTLYVPADEEYEFLPQKTFWLAFWACRNGFDFLFKCDDDTFVQIDRLVDVVRNEPPCDYRGYGVAPGIGAGGAGYLLSARAIRKIAEAIFLATAIGAEDVLVSKILAETGIDLKKDARFGSDARRVPLPGNNQITAHGITATAMHAAYHSFNPEPAKQMQTW